MVKPVYPDKRKVPAETEQYKGSARGTRLQKLNIQGKVRSLHSNCLLQRVWSLPYYTQCVSLRMKCITIKINRFCKYFIPLLTDYVQQGRGWSPMDSVSINGVRVLVCDCPQARGWSPTYNAQSISQSVKYFTLNALI